jgi:hypothetical protein
VNCDTLPGRLAGYLAGTMTQDDTAFIRAHLDACQSCWDTWNSYRWDQAACTSLYRDLKAFLGTTFIHGLDSSRALAREWDRASPRTPGEAADFFRTNTSYLYNLTIWEASGNRPRYVTAAAPLLARLNSRSVVDYGSGIGSDTLALRRLGLKVTPCDYHSPSTRFFQWRATRSRQDTRVYEPGQLPPGLRPDTLWIIDTLDHLPDIEASIGPLLDSAQTLICEQLADDRAHGRQGFHRRRPPGEIACAYASRGFCLLASAQEIQCWARQH